MFKPLFLCATMALALSACSSPAEKQRSERARIATRALERAGATADPGKVAATEIAFARAARDNGQWTAFREYAAPGARLDAPGGALTPAMMAELGDPPQSASWVPTAVWSSCDGTLAVSFGRLTDANGMVGDYVTVWEWQSTGEYRWIYTTGTPDDPQPVPRQREAVAAGEDVILVDALTAIEGRSADCPQAGAERAPAIMPVSADGTATQAHASADETLKWFRARGPDGSLRVSADYLRDGRWQRVLDLTVPAP